MSEVNLREYLGWGDHTVQVDGAAGIIRGVKVLGLQSRNGRRYTEEALRTAVPLYEGAKVNVNHPQGEAAAPRDYRDRLGLLRHVHYRAGEGLFADLYFNPKHDVAERLVWDARHAPQNVGLSHNVLARIRREGDITVVDEILRVLSVDVVADPASTQGLFESQNTPAESSPVEDRTPIDSAAPVDLEEEVRRLRRELALRRRLADSFLKPPGDAEPGKVPLGDVLWRILLDDANEQHQSRLVAELHQLVESARRISPKQLFHPESRDGLREHVELTAEEFARAIKNRTF
ncbi:hypothetical protein THTE_0530 [Thermogutta terrifontis]|uniref:Uncharacterized protein n=1 Tax=Thermogutta terrifontis TaxID=1331910 RepID=A0A286RAY8_9BACT|nr:hypothetical protein [Thermogutta terrifontis]ASV73132.1 hypothetical protein THTE_0530 [Thermogutta terrifontis]